MADHRDAGGDECARTLDRSAAALDLHEVAVGFFDEALRGRDRLPIGCFVRTERQIPDEQRRSQPPPHRFGEHEHLIDGHRHGAVVAEHRHGARVADEHDVDARGLDDLRAGVVVGGDHDDRLTSILLRGQRTQGDPFARRRVHAHAPAPTEEDASVSSRSTTSSTWMIAFERSTCTTTGS